MTVNPVIGRRTALSAGVTGAGALALAACGADSSGSSSGSTTSSQPSQAGQRVAALADIKVGEAIAAKIGGKNVLVSRPTEATAACFSAVCTHEGCTVKPDGATLACPCHGSTFAATTGKVLGGPAPAPLRKIAVTVTDGEVMTA